MKINNIEWMSEEALEAIISITDCTFECIAFSQPCFYNINDRIKSPLISVDTWGFTKEVKGRSFSIKRQNYKSHFFIKILLGF